MKHSREISTVSLVSVATAVVLTALLTTGAESFFCAAPLPARRININDERSHTSGMAIAATPRPTKDALRALPTGSPSFCSACCIASVRGTGMPKLLVDGDGGGGSGNGNGGGSRGGGGEGSGDSEDHDHDGDDRRLQPDLFAAAGLGGALEGLKEALQSFRLPWSKKVRRFVIGYCCKQYRQYSYWIKMRACPYSLYVVL